MLEEFVSEHVVVRPRAVAMITVLFLGVVSCASGEPSGVVARPQLRTCCEIAGVGESPARAITAISATDASPELSAESLDEFNARLARDVPGGFGGQYLDDEGRLVAVLVDPSQRDAALSTLESLTGNPDWRNARIVKGDYDWGQLYHWYYERLLPELTCRDVYGRDIDELINRIVLDVLDEKAAECVARNVLALGEVPCAAVVIRTGAQLGIPD